MQVSSNWMTYFPVCFSASVPSSDRELPEGRGEKLHLQGLHGGGPTAGSYPELDKQKSLARRENHGVRVE